MIVAHEPCPEASIWLRVGVLSWLQALAPSPRAAAERNVLTVSRALAASLFELPQAARPPRAAMAARLVTAQRAAVRRSTRGRLQIQETSGVAGGSPRSAARRRWTR